MSPDRTDHQPPRSESGQPAGPDEKAIAEAMDALSLAAPHVRAQGDTDLSERRALLRRIAAANRSLIEDMVGADMPPEELAQAAEAMEGLAERFRTDRPRSLYEGMAEAALAGGDVNVFFDHSPLMGMANPIAPPIMLEFVDDVVIGRVTFASVYEGPPGCVHGGFVAAAFDEVLGSAQTFSGAPGMTARLTVNYRRPTPLHAPLQIEGRLDRVEGRKVFTSGKILADGQVTAEAQGLFISIDQAKFRQLTESFDRRMADEA